MKKLVVFLGLAALLMFPVYTSANTEVEKLVFENVKLEEVKWNGLTLKKGQIGLIEIKKKVNLWKRVGNKLEAVRVLKPGEKYRVYSSDQKFGGQYGLGGNLYITNVAGSIKYSTPPKSLVSKVNPKIYDVKVEPLGHSYFSLDVGTSEQGKLFLMIKPSEENPNFTGRASTSRAGDGTSIVFHHEPIDYSKWNYNNKDQYFFEKYADHYNRYTDDWFIVIGTNLNGKTTENGKYIHKVSSLPMSTLYNQAIVKGFYMVGGPDLEELQKKIIPVKNQYIEKVQPYMKETGLRLSDFGERADTSHPVGNHLNTNFVVHPPEGGREFMAFQAGKSALVTDGYNRFLILDAVFENEKYIKTAAKSLVALGYPKTESKIIEELKKVKETGETVFANKNAYIKRSNYIKDVYVMWK